MKVKDILSVLPRISDCDEYEVTFVKAEDNLRKMHWKRIETRNYQSGEEELPDDLLNAEILSIEAGRVRPGGSLNSELHVYVEYAQAHGTDESETHNEV